MFQLRVEYLGINKIDIPCQVSISSRMIFYERNSWDERGVWESFKELGETYTVLRDGFRDFWDLWVMGLLTRHGFLFVLSMLAILASQNSSSAVTLSTTSYRMAS